MKNKRINFKGMKFKLVSSLVSICLIPLIIFGLTSYFKVEGIVCNNFKDASQQNINQVKEIINNYFMSVKSPIDMLSKNKNLQDIDKNKINEELIRAHLVDMKSLNKDVIGVFLAQNQVNILIILKVPLIAILIIK